jgi:hypothetical protein
MRFVRTIPAVALALMVGLPTLLRADDSDEFFEKRIRPVLTERCFECHSGTIAEPKSGLRVDSRAGLLRGGTRGAAIVPGSPEKSRVIEAIGYNNVHLQMPPKGKLPDTAIADLKKWVQMGAPWPGAQAASTSPAKPNFDLAKRKQEHWAWQPLQSSQVPAVGNSAWPRSPIDSFILSKLQESGLEPAPPADAAALIRRLYFDLTGLPPPESSIPNSEFRIPNSELERLVDHLLGSPQFGERWARHWLDLVRYAESRGHEFDYNLPNAYQYRDYVIRALNQDLPYDQFVTEHIAGDLLKKPRLHPSGFNESILATGFWFLGEELHSPVDVRQDEADRFDNRIDVFSKTFLGLTVACARCHDHKFDAISTKDYYALFGFLSSSNYRLVRFDGWEQNRKVLQELEALRAKNHLAICRELVKLLKPAIQKLAANAPAVPSPVVPKIKDDAEKRHRDWQHSLRDIQVIVDYSQPEAPWLPDDGTFGPRAAHIGDVRWRIGTNRILPRFVETGAAEMEHYGDRWVSMGGEADAGAVKSDQRAGRTIRTPSFTISNGKLFYLVKGSAEVYAAVSQHLLIAGPLHARLMHSIKAGKEYRWVGQDLSVYKGLPAHVEFTAEPGSDFAIAMVVQGEQPPPLPPVAPIPAAGNEPSPGSFAEIVATNRFEFEHLLEALEDGLPNESQSAKWARLTNWLVEHPECWGCSTDKLSEIFRPYAEAEAAVEARFQRESRLAIAIQDGAAFNEHVFVRGSPHAPGELAPRQLLEALDGNKHPILSKGSGRLELARQVTDPKQNPFIARVIVNRVWQHLMGRGIVASVDNFGVLGEKPTHPELLDYLATEFIREGWSIKKLIRKIVLSNAYQMSCRASDKANEIDPRNQLWQHMPIRRLEGEAIRDAMLALAGKLNSQMYGPSMPVHLNEFQDGRGRPPSGPLDGGGRRSVYLSVRRNFLSSFLLAFDTPTPFSTVGRRTVSNVPAQALILMNDPFVAQQAELWARRIVASEVNDDARIRKMYRQAFAHEPRAAELAECARFLKEQAQASGTNTEDVSVWRDLAHVLLNAKEFIWLQ